MNEQYQFHKSEGTKLLMVVNSSILRLILQSRNSGNKTLTLTQADVKLEKHILQVPRNDIERFTMHSVTEGENETFKENFRH